MPAFRAPMNPAYAETEPKREEVDRLLNATRLEFGSPWCGSPCGAAAIEAMLAEHAGVRHIKVTDASGRQLSRSFNVKYSPTLVFLLDGEKPLRVVVTQRAGDPRSARANRCPAVNVKPTFSNSTASPGRTASMSSFAFAEKSMSVMSCTPPVMIT